MKRTDKRITILVLTAILLAEIVLSALAAAYFLLLHHYKGSESRYEWSEADPIDLSAIPKVEKQKGKDFVILNLADIQLCDLEDLFRFDTIRREIDELVNRTDPDLITLTGDQTWSNENLISLRTLIDWLDSYRIPYAPVFGNHDSGNEKDAAVAGVGFCCDMYESGEYSLFRRGPSNIGGAGNYAVNVCEDGKIVKTLYMLDAGNEEIISDAKIAWMRRTAEGIKEENGGVFPEAMVFMHKPIPEYFKAYAGYLAGTIEPVGEVHVHFSLAGTEPNGFFEAAKEIRVTDIVCGHQHGNCFTIPFEGVRLTFAAKTGEAVSFYEDGDVYLNGATCFILGDGGVEVEHIFVDRGKYRLT